MRFRSGHALVALALFVVEVVISLFVRDRFVRPYLGDLLAVIFASSTRRCGQHFASSR